MVNPATRHSRYSAVSGSQALIIHVSPNPPHGDHLRAVLRSTPTLRSVGHSSTRRPTRLHGRRSERVAANVYAIRLRSCSWPCTRNAPSGHVRHHNLEVRRVRGWAATVDYSGAASMRRVPADKPRNPGTIKLTHEALGGQPRRAAS
eukprot:scaffold2844_cov31-Tisochrysis_lutea.AAC.4